MPTNLFKVSEISQSLALMMNAGMDMIMIPGYRGEKGVTDIYDGLKSAVSQGIISMDRLNEAVARILAVKLVMGVAFEQRSLNTHLKPSKVEVHASSEY